MPLHGVLIVNQANNMTAVDGPPWFSVTGRRSFWELGKKEFLLDFDDL